MSGVSLRQVTKDFGAVHAVRSVSFDIRDGEFVVLVGPSGCGKSTLLRMIAGLETVTDGDIAIGDRVVNTIRPRDRDVAMVFQNYALYPHMTVAKNMGFSLQLRGASAAEIDQKVRAAAAMLDLEALLDRFPRQLSGGQRQRVAMGRAVVRRPQVFLFDEPLSNLDASLRVQMRSEIRALHQRLGTTTLYVTHDQVEAMTLADRIVVLRDGRVEQVGAPLQVYDRPTNVFVAGFMGSPAMNTVSGRLVEEHGRLVCETADGIRLPVLASGSVGAEVLFGVRPEHVHLTADGVPADVEFVEPTGSETQVALRLGSTRLLSACRDRVTLEPGDRVCVAIDPAHAHLFDAATGQRIDS